MAVKPERMKEPNEAREVLSDPELRAREEELRREAAERRRREEAQARRHREEEKLGREAAEKLRREEAERRRKEEAERIRREAEARRHREEEERLRREAAERRRREEAERRRTARVRKVVALFIMAIMGLSIGALLYPMPARWADKAVTGIWLYRPPVAQPEPTDLAVGVVDQSHLVTATGTTSYAPFNSY